MGLAAALLLALPCLCAGLGAWLWLSTRYLLEERIHLRRRPALIPLYCTALLSAATKPRRLHADRRFSGSRSPWQRALKWSAALARGDCPYPLVSHYAAHMQKGGWGERGGVGGS